MCQRCRRTSLASNGHCMRWKNAHELFHNAVRAQQGRPAEWASSPQAIVKRCPERACLASDAEWLLAAFLFDATAVTSWDGAARAALARELLGESVRDFTPGARLSVRILHYHIQIVEWRSCCVYWKCHGFRVPCDAASVAIML